MLARLVLESTNVPIKLRAPDGSIVDGTFSGYYDMTLMGEGTPMSIGYPDGAGHLTHGSLRDGWEVVSPVPSFEQWRAEEEATKKALTGSV